MLDIKQSCKQHFVNITTMPVAAKNLSIIASYFGSEQALVKR